jgi:hypothetical protein
VIVTVHVVLAPPTREEAATLNVLIVGAVISNAPVTLVVPSVPPIFAVVFVAIFEVVAVNVAVLLPAAIVTDPGT